MKIRCLTPHEQIADLESEIEDLSEAADRCARTMLLAKASIASGVLATTLGLTGLLGLTPVLFVIVIAAILGGIALFGSSRSTRDQITATMRMREAERVAMIDQLELQGQGYLISPPVRAAKARELLPTLRNVA